MVLALALKEGWKTRQIDYVLAFCQANAEHEHLYMEIPKGVTIDNKNPKDHVLHVKKNLFGQPQAGRVWNQHLTKKLKEVGFQQSEHDECLFFRGSCIYVLYTDDSILTGPDEKEMDKVMADLKKAGLKLTCDGTLGDFLGVKIEEKESEEGKKEFHLTQPHLIEQILKELQLAQRETM